MTKGRKVEVPDHALVTVTVDRPRRNRLHVHDWGDQNTAGYVHEERHWKHKKRLRRG